MYGQMWGVKVGGDTGGQVGGGEIRDIQMWGREVRGMQLRKAGCGASRCGAGRRLTPT